MFFRTFRVPFSAYFCVLLRLFSALCGETDTQLPEDHRSHSTDRPAPPKRAFRQVRTILRADFWKIWISKTNSVPDSLTFLSLFAKMKFMKI